MGEQEPAASPLEAMPWRIPVGALSRGANTGLIEAIEEERLEVARALGLLALDHLALDWRLAPLSRGRWRLTGRLHARLEQACVVSLEPVAQDIEEEVSAVFVPDAGERGAVVDNRQPAPAQNSRSGARDGRRDRHESEREIVLDPDEDAIEPILNGQIVLGRLAYEVLAVSLDPYPRAEGASWPPADGGGAGEASA